jgi:hypothetical protein
MLRLLVFGLFSIQIFAFASAQTMIPENLATTSSEVALGRGYLPKSLEVSVGGCAVGSWNIKTELTALKPFENPVFYKMKTGVRVVFLAVSSHRENRTVKPFQYRNEPVCGTQYVSSVVVGAKLALIFNYWTTAEQVDQLEVFLKSNLSDLHNIFNVNPVNAGIKMNGFGILFDGSGATDKLGYYNSTCQWSAKYCDYYLEEAYAAAENLDLPKPKPVEDVISFTVDDYPAAK